MVLTRMERAGEITDDRVASTIARSRHVKELVDAIWPPLDPVRVLMAVLGDADTLAEVADGLLDELRSVLDRSGGVGHVVLDETQDLSPRQLRAVRQRIGTGSATVLGDIAQGTTPWATSSWTTALEHLGQPDAVVAELRRGYRVPGAVIDPAARLLPYVAPDIAPPVAVRSNPGQLTKQHASASALWREVLSATGAMLAHAGSVGVIVADEALQIAEQTMVVLGVVHDNPRLSVVATSVVKGLEHNHVVLVEPAQIVRAEPRGLHRLYVAPTRAVSSLVIVHAEAMPTDLR